MNGWAELDRLLITNPQDSGCAHAMELLDVYADLIDYDAAAARFHPDIAAHLTQCGPCAQDLAGLLNAIHNNVPG